MTKQQNKCQKTKRSSALFIYQNISNVLFTQNYNYKDVQRVLLGKKSTVEQMILQMQLKDHFMDRFIIFFITCKCKNNNLLLTLYLSLFYFSGQVFSLSFFIFKIFIQLFIHLKLYLLYYNSPKITMVKVSAFLYFSFILVSFLTYFFF